MKTDVIGLLLDLFLGLLVSYPGSLDSLRLLHLGLVDEVGHRETALAHARHEVQEQSSLLIESLVTIPSR